MKKFLSFLFAGLILTACSLDEKIESSSVKSNYYKTAAQCRTGLNGCYIPLRSIYGNVNYFALTECQADMMYINQSGFPDAILLVSPDKPQFGSTLWTQGYGGVMRCNAMDAAIRRAPLSDAEKAPLMAEMTILRAFFYYILTSNFGNVPFYEEEVTSANNDSIACLPRYAASKIREKMMEEIRLWIVDRQALPLVRTYDVSSNPEYRVGAAVGLMLAGRMALWDGKWDEAVEFFSYLETIYGDLDAYSLADVKFRNKYTPESIFEIPYVKEDYKLQVFQSLASRCMPPRSVQENDENGSELDDTDFKDIQADYYGGIGIPELGRLSTTRSAIRPTTKLRTLLPYTGNDRRTCSNKASGDVEGGGGWLAWGWKGYSKDDDRSTVQPAWHWFCPSGTDFSQNSTPYLGDKFWCFNMSYTYDDNNLKVFRYAGAILGLAEAWRELGDLDKAIDYLNKVRHRAFAGEYPKDSYSTDKIRQLIMDEYGIELFGEFGRKHDLVRWDVWDEYVQGNTQAWMLNENRRPCHRYYPIPSEQITYSKGALDNKEYNHYGL